MTMEISVYTFEGGYHVVVHGVMHKILVNKIISEDELVDVPADYPRRADLAALLTALKKENWQ